MAMKTKIVTRKSKNKNHLQWDWQLCVVPTTEKKNDVKQWTKKLISFVKIETDCFSYFL